MSRVRQFLGLFQDSPTYGRDRANLISGFTIGTTALMLNAAVLFLVLPLMLAPDDRDFRDITENVEFGQILGLILLGGATVLATALIPLRLVTVFWGPRIGRYFDQIVLSGISPLRFVIGKATSQNLFLGLIAFLLLPYLVLSLTLGGIDFGTFLASLFLVWLYCMTLAMVTLWASLYLNELLSAMLVSGTAVVLSVLGCIPMSPQPFVLTPFPVLLHSIYSAMPYFRDELPTGFLPLFVASTVAMTSVLVVSLIGITIGPLFGIIRENSTFGEVVREGDNKRKRWFRLRLHIQRPSEIAFFYENRGDVRLRYEGLLRWGLGLAGLLLALFCATGFVVLWTATQVMQFGTELPDWWSLEFLTVILVAHIVGLVIAVWLFSHGKNTTLIRLPLAFGRSCSVARMDLSAFLMFLAASTTIVVGTPFLFEHFIARPEGVTVFSQISASSRANSVDYVRLVTEGYLAISVAGLTVYLLHRLACMVAWVRSAAFVAVAGLYGVFVVLLPTGLGVLVYEVPEIRNVAILKEWMPTLGMMSPLTLLMLLYGELGAGFWAADKLSTIPFYVFHGTAIFLAIYGIRRQGIKLRAQYLNPHGATPRAGEI